ncbi:NifB/NifX family molybdenum-iron cluster-binding protein [Aestuariirhabdus sp. LZHN29]|uniref:NifB/NifX family molybdenum-iron cluster-binding protein n=1 Tax=Aestuariirhabdus sp. LZHN29 TaxID=3417462 RepID=UPI003CF0119F
MSKNHFQFTIAFATNGGDVIDGHFGSCTQFDIYRFDVDSILFVESRTAKSVEGIEKNGVRADQLSDCDLLFVASIGGPAAAKVIRHGIHPLKDTQLTPVYDALKRLQNVLATNPPPWMAKRMGLRPSAILEAG